MKAKRGIILLAAGLPVAWIAVWLRLPAGIGTTRCHEMLEGGFCGIETRRHFYLPSDLPPRLSRPGLPVLFLGAPTGGADIYMHGQPIHLLMVVGLPRGMRMPKRLGIKEERCKSYWFVITIDRPAMCCGLVSFQETR